MYECPWCRRKSFSFWQKQWLGPTREIKCTACTRKVSVPWGKAHIAASPLLVGAIFGLVVWGPLLGEGKLGILFGGIFGAVFGMLLTAPIYHLYVPLVKPGRQVEDRGDDDEDEDLSRSRRG